MNNLIEIQTAEEFDEHVTKSDMPVLVDFWAEWCGPCKQLAPLVEQLAEEQKDKIKVCKADVDMLREVAAKYNVRSIPTLIVFSKGNPIGAEIGALTKQQLDEFVISKI